MISLYSFTSTSSSKSFVTSVFYRFSDRLLILVQRILFCMVIFLGYDISPAPHGIPESNLIDMFVRIVRNFFFITKAVRKWLSITLNDGIIPPPPVKTYRNYAPSRVRSTPNSGGNASDDALSTSLKPSPIERRYTEDGTNYGLATAWKEREKSMDNCPLLYYSDSEAGSSLNFSLKSIITNLYQSFTGTIEDPDDEEQSRRAKNKNYRTVDSQIDQSENDRRANLVTKSVLERDQRLRDGGEKKIIEPLTPPNFESVDAIGLNTSN